MCRPGGTHWPVSGPPTLTFSRPSDGDLDVALRAARPAAVSAWVRGLLPSLAGPLTPGACEKQKRLFPFFPQGKKEFSRHAPQPVGGAKAQPTGCGLDLDLDPSGPRSGASLTFRFHFLAPKSFGRGTSHGVPFVLRPLRWCCSGPGAPPDARPKRTAPPGTRSRRLLLQLSVAATPAGKDAGRRPGPSVH